MKGYIKYNLINYINSIFKNTYNCRKFLDKINLETFL